MDKSECFYCESKDTMDKRVYLCYECFIKLDDVQKILFSGDSLKEKMEMMDELIDEKGCNES